MSGSDRETEKSEEFETGRALWRHCRAADAPADEAARFLELAAFADGLLDDEEHDRVAADVATDPVAAADVAAMRALAGAPGIPPAELEHIIARASALVDPPPPETGLVLPFRALSARRRILQGLAQWGSLAAAIVVASWLGFAMGSGASLDLTQPSQSQVGADGLLPELLDPSTGFLRDLGEGLQT
jgi:anti-sigma factor RsiW